MGIEYKTLKRVKKNFDEIFTKFKKTDEIHIVIDGNTYDKIELRIINQQCGILLDEPKIDIMINSCTFSMSKLSFIKMVDNYFGKDI